MTPSRAVVAASITAAVLVALTFAPVLGLGYVWDDWVLFLQNPALRLPELAWEAIFQPILPGTTYFRPIPLASFALVFNTLGIDPTISHAGNLLIHSTNTLLVCLITARVVGEAHLLGRGWRVLAAGLVYGLHPALIEPVAWVSGRFDLMVTLFVLAGIWGYLTFEGWRRDLWTAAAFLLAALSKEMAVAMPLLLALFFIARNGRAGSWASLVRQGIRAREWRLYALLAGAGLVVLVLRHWLLGALSHDDVEVLGKLSSPLHHMAFVGQTLLFYLRMSLWPFADLNPQHPFDPADMSSAAYAAGIATVALALVAIVLGIRTRRWPALLLSGWAVALLPVLNIIPLTTGGNIGHERFLALPLALLTLGLATLTMPPLSDAMRRVLPVAGGGLAVLLAILAVANIRVTLPLWQDDLSLWTWAYEKHPDFPFVQSSYVSAAIRHHQYDRAKAVIDADDRPNSYFMIGLHGLYLLRTGNPAEALSMFEKASDTLGGPHPHEVILSYGIPLEEARLTRMPGRQWFYQSNYTAMIEAQVALRQFDAGLESAKVALFYAPNYPSAWTAKAFALYGAGRWTEAEEAFAHGLHLLFPEVREDTQQLREQFLAQLCDIRFSTDRTTEVCNKWTAESAQPPFAGNVPNQSRGRTRSSM